MVIFTDSATALISNRTDYLSLLAILWLALLQIRPPWREVPGSPFGLLGSLHTWALPERKLRTRSRGWLRLPPTILKEFSITVYRAVCQRDFEYWAPSSGTYKKLGGSWADDFSRVNVKTPRLCLHDASLPRRYVNLITRLRTFHICTDDHFIQMGWTVALRLGTLHNSSTSAPRLLLVDLLCILT